VTPVSTVDVPMGRVSVSGQPILVDLAEMKNKLS
jgi:hypothetical protein